MIAAAGQERYLRALALQLEARDLPSDVVGAFRYAAGLPHAARLVALGEIHAAQRAAHRHALEGGTP